MEEHRHEFLLLLHDLSHIGHGDLALNAVAGMIIMVTAICRFRLIIIFIGMVNFTLASVDLSHW